MPGPVRGARAGPGCSRWAGVPVPIRGARANPGCQDAKTNPGCQSQSGLPGTVWDARANQDAKASLGCECQSDEDATLRMLRSHLCNSICCALLLHSNRSALVYIYIYVYIFETYYYVLTDDFVYFHLLGRNNGSHVCKWDH